MRRTQLTRRSAGTVPGDDEPGAALATVANARPRPRSVVPATYDASSLINHAIASATSCGSPARPSGTAATRSGAARLAGVGVDRGAHDTGCDADDRTPSPATSWERPA